MKWLAVLAVVSVLAVWALFMREAPAPSGPSASIPAMPQSIPARPVASAPALASAGRDAQAWRRMALRGVLFQGHDTSASQALLSIDGHPAQIFRAGQPLLEGWALQSIHADHVTIANGPDLHRLDVMQPGPAAAAASAPAGGVAKEVTLPGFTPSSVPAAVAAPPPSVETNRRFLQDRQKRQAGTSP